ncbi:dTDP-4-amino-4,6-dideoxygalactose transaminase [Rhizobium laguerreae]|uniref:dTDP-4-amino-4,6-dideoxygalactose transaminase n=1 Tax=Rhizobium laguerreae TaxID=1076926 RepID=UPI001C909F63|nr:dTDP-4-amino-4,6-dideoxygalactose transaminase [Rhizobium laguerreae]MBY3165953.1 dTDP-4-amino-4,6-dideoxygalactose transaminase [Rhizobium laguerreae]
MSEKIPFNRLHFTGHDLENLVKASTLAGDGAFTKQCSAWLERETGTRRALLTHSCTAALEMAALLLDIQPGDEVIMPSFTFVSTANAFVLRGGVPIFVDIREDTLNLDESLIEAAITPRTKVIVPVHYAGVACNMDVILDIARRYNLKVVEDAAQGVYASYKGRALGSIGDLGAYSFHETKNVISGEGGAILVNDEDLVRRAEIIREKGTDRSRFFRGEVDKYTWQDVGSSFLPSELIAAFLYGQLTSAQDITARRIAVWNNYHEMLAPLEERGLLRRPIIPVDCTHNAHMYYVLLSSNVERSDVLHSLAGQGINAVFHYIPLHNSPAGGRFGRVHGDLKVTDTHSERLVRLPLWIGLGEADQLRIVSVLDR